ncbi:NAD-dependent epimerase/dehydratase family protein [Winogradskya humida]|uniref:NAD-dependent epimerase n=1 Tax=Winogradskya humida TaxID=113566 RepID=A0ABQ4A7M7_9ACTN|nr:NAD-dependent epimerase/dehydratase family protein [Actinoplanes humidus]GIE26834.1 NAD-dependent epimerase [Actinoplanes humidus]
MDIIGRGFLARNLACLAGRHHRVVAIAAGASSTAATGADLDREADLVRDVALRCRLEQRTVILFSTASHALYGSTTAPVAEHDPVNPASAFGHHKLRLERLVAASGAPWLVLRVSHAVGPYQRSHQFFPAMVRAVGTGYVRVHRDAARDLIDVVTVVRTVDALAGAGISDEVINVATGLPHPVPDIVAAIESALGRAATVHLVDAPPAAATVSVAKLHHLIPGLGSPRDGAEDLHTLVHRYAPLYSTADP